MPREEATTSPRDYSARHLSVLEGLEAVRKRPGMYIGSTDQRGLMHCVWEIVDNGVDEALEGYGDRIDVTVHDDGSVEVRDTGRGVPVDVEPSSGLTGVELVYTKLHAGGKFGGGSYGAAGGLHGVGASVVNALSARMDVEVDRGGKTYAMSFRRGVPGVFTDPSTGPDLASPFTEYTHQTPELRVIGKVRRGVTGTRVRYWADPQIFPSPTEYDAAALRARLRQTSFLIPGLTLTLTDERSAEETARAERMPSSGSKATDDLALRAAAKNATRTAEGLLDASPATEIGEADTAVFRAEGGTADFVDFLATDGSVTDTFRLTGQGVYTETVQQLDRRSGHLRPVEVERTCDVDIALRWGIGYDTTERSFVNIIATPMGGTHLTGFEQAVVKVLRKQIGTNARALKVTSRDGRIEKDDILAGLTAVVTVRVPEPQFEGQTKEVLGTAPVRQIVAKVVTEELTALLTSMMSTDAATYETNLADLGWADLDTPSQIDIYPTSFAAKERVKQALDDYNAAQEEAGAQDRVIVYNDLVGLLMGAVTRIVDIISWMLIAFVSISLVVSSIMIAIITYISVLERKKEIGILRSVGASKRDIRHVFNAETVIEGLGAGLLGIVITLLLCIPVNLIVEDRFGVADVARLPALAALALIGVSVLLTVLAGLAPAARAAREDPVEALRSE